MTTALISPEVHKHVYLKPFMKVKKKSATINFTENRDDFGHSHCVYLLNYLNMIFCFLLQQRNGDTSFGSQAIAGERSRKIKGLTDHVVGEVDCVFGSGKQLSFYKLLVTFRIF